MRLRKLCAEGAKEVQEGDRKALLHNPRTFALLPGGGNTPGRGAFSFFRTMT